MLSLQTDRLVALRVPRLGFKAMPSSAWWFERTVRHLCVRPGWAATIHDGGAIHGASWVRCIGVGMARALLHLKASSSGVAPPRHCTWEQSLCTQLPRCVLCCAAFACRRRLLFLACYGIARARVTPSMLADLETGRCQSEALPLLSTARAGRGLQ